MTVEPASIPHSSKRKRLTPPANELLFDARISNRFDLQEAVEEHLKTGDFALAIELLKSRLRTSPDDLQLHHYPGKVFLAAGQLHEAKSAFTDHSIAVLIYSVLHIELGRLLEQKSKLDQAEFHYREALKLDPLPHQAYLSARTKNKCSAI